MLACLYDRQVRSVNDVAGYVVCKGVGSAEDGMTPHFTALFRLLLQRYLSGVGHPPQLRGSIIDDDEWTQQVNNNLFRVSLLLEAATETDLRPTSQSWKINVRVVITLRSAVSS